MISEGRDKKAQPPRNTGDGDGGTSSDRSSGGSRQAAGLPASAVMRGRALRFEVARLPAGLFFPLVEHRQQCTWPEHALYREERGKGRGMGLQTVVSWDHSRGLVKNRSRTGALPAPQSPLPLPSLSLLTV